MPDKQIITPQVAFSQAENLQVHQTMGSTANGRTSEATVSGRTFEYRAFQQTAIVDLRAALRDQSSVILYAPTGAGKTAIACDITAKAAALGRCVLFIGDSTEIIEQTSETMTFWNISHGIIQAGNKNRKPWERVHIGTIQTLRNRELPRKDLVFIDECHLSRSKTWHAVIQHYLSLGAKVIGLSATPCRLDGKGLGALFQSIVYCPSIQELTDLGYLVPFRVYAPPAPKTEQVHIVAGDFNKGELSEMMDRSKLIGDAVEHYGKVARGRLAILAATSIEHSLHLRDAFRAAGIAAEHADGNTPREERKRVLSMPSPGVICQVEICGKGWDRRDVSCAIDCRPTKSLARWLQFVGRSIRTCDGKSDAILLDHAGNVHRFGMPDGPRVWAIDETAAPARAADPALSVCTCRRCYATFRRGPDECPYCDYAIERQSRTIEVDAGTLEEIQRERKLKSVQEWRSTVTGEERRKKFEEFRKLAQDRNYNKSWPYVRFRVVFGQDVPKEWSKRA